MTDFRALCAELVAELEAWESADDEFSSGGTVRSDADYKLAPRARAALAQSEPQGPGRTAIEPVPVAERLPGADDVDENGNCWLWDSEGYFWDWTYIRTRTRAEMYSYTHWLPHHALPVPHQEVNDD